MSNNDQRYLVKCACEKCDCPSATIDAVCYECAHGFHVHRWQDGEVERAYEVGTRERPEYCARCGEPFRSGERAFAAHADAWLVHERCKEEPKQVCRDCGKYPCACAREV